MNQHLESLEESRKMLIDMTRDLGEEGLNFIPPGYKNNIIWNMGHMLAVSESILYKNSAFRPPVHEFDITLFSRDTKPELRYGNEAILLIRQSLLETVKIFKQATKGFHVPDEGAVRFLLFHENIHHRAIGRLIHSIDHSPIN